MSGRPGFNHRVNLGAIGTLLTAVAFLIVLFGSSIANSQVLYGSLTGTVADKLGAVIPGATVTITNQGTGEARSTKANGLGSWDILDVLPGAYSVSVPAQGSFGGFAEKDVQIEPNRQVRVDIVLQAATVSTRITVTEAPPALQTETGEVNSEINSTELGQLPLTSTAGRSYQALYTLIPGGASVKEQKLNRFQSLPRHVGECERPKHERQHHAH